MMNRKALRLPLVALLPFGVSGCGWANHQIDHAMNGGPVAKKPIPGFTAEQARDRITAYLQESLRSLPDGWSYADYAIGDGPSDSGFGGSTNYKVNDHGSDKDSPYKLLVFYWVHYPEGTAEEAFDKLAAYWTAHAQTVTAPHIPPKTGLSESFREASFATAGHYSFDLTVNQNHALATNWSSPYFAYDPSYMNKAFMPQTITKNGASAFGEPPK
ncbi:hypothetical protein Srot_3040 [Segniliparus rotundus DSM 44985]|uniref:Lipoprotein n=1 Tax=Segniliparus rotundus (strain ATCC BAA-972 / CDC 1076 / CIP 108378 / DSM 44985 / JCM 13578) TaxID=640132 RepID=D6ZEI8_SEGRD|nr:hypothetical protein [Segniliparus rotundus]ADG99464.1 hypothetical protein Srot_3040 [Segniliparus rotundus DSM 44985]